jgi:uncharacterized protein YndB with AHSA1/START domain
VKTTIAEAAVRVERTIPAPQERVWELWTRPEHLMRWWGPTEGLELFRCEIDLRPGGRYRYAMRPKGAEGPVEAVGGVFEAVEPPSRLVFTWVWEGGGEAVDTRVTVAFADAGPGATRVAVLHERQPSDRVAAVHRRGWTDKLADLAREAGA